MQLRGSRDVYEVGELDSLDRRAGNELAAISEWITVRPIALLTQFSFADEALELGRVEEDVVLADEPVARTRVRSIPSSSKGP
jgi:hypothetical protein